MNRPSWCFFGEIPSVAEGGGFEPPVREPVRQFSKLLVSATHPSFQKDPGVRNLGVISSNAGAKVRLFFQSCKYFVNFFRKKLFEGHYLRQLWIEVEGVLQGVALVYITHSQVVKVARGFGTIADLLFEQWCSPMTHHVDE